MRTLTGYAEQIGLNMDEFRAALDNRTYQEEVQRQMAEGQGFGVRGTPSWFVNGRMYSGAQAPAQIRALFDAELEE